MKHVRAGQPRAGPSGRSRAIRTFVHGARNAHQGDGGDSEHVQPRVFARRQAHRVPQQSQRHAAGVDGRCRRRRAEADHAGQRSGRLRRVVAGRGPHCVRCRARRRLQRAGVTTASPTAPTPSASRAAARKTTSPAASRPTAATGSAPRSATRSRPIRGSTIRRPARRRSRSSTMAFGGINDIERPANRALIGRLVTRGNTNLYLHDLQTHQEILLTPHEGPALASGELAPDGSAVYVVHNLGRDRQVRLAHSDRCRGQTRCDDSCSPSATTPKPMTFTISEDGRRAVLTWNVGGRTELELVSLAGRQAHAVRDGRPARWSRSAISRPTAAAWR